MKKFFVLLCALLASTFVSCSTYEPEPTYDEGYSKGYDNGYDDGYYDGYEVACEDSREEFISELYGIDGYLPVYMDEEIFDTLERLADDSYQQDEYTEIVYDYFAANRYQMTPEQVEAFENTIPFCDDSAWITHKIFHDIQFPPS